MIRKASEFGWPELASAFNRGFEGYFVVMNESAASLSQHLQAEDVSLDHSPVFIVDNAIVGFTFVAERGNRARIAAMGVAPAFRGKGVGKQLLAHAMKSLASRRYEKIHLECVGQNAPALALYQGLGFKPFRRLLGYENPTLEKIEAPVETIPLEEYASFLVGIDGLPWQLTRETISRMEGELLAYRLGEAVASSRKTESGMLCTGIVSRRKGDGSKLLYALAHRFGEVKFSALLPEEMAPGFFARLGFKPRDLFQWELSRDNLHN